MPDRSSFSGYAVAIGTVLGATVSRLALDPFLGSRYPFATLFFAVLVSAWFGGFAPALVATGSGALAAAWFLLPPRPLGDVESMGGLFLYLAVGIGIAAIGGKMRRARAAAELEAGAAAASRDVLRVTLQSIGDAVITTDVAGRITSLNTVGAAITGWTLEQARGRPLEEVFRIINEETREPAESPIRKVLAQGRVLGLANHTVLIARDGTERPIDDTAAPIRDRDGVMEGVVLVFRDVTERRSRENRLRTSEQELSDFFENVNVGLHWVGPDGIIQRVNRAELEMLGYSREEYVGHHIAEFHVDAAVIAEILSRLAAGESLIGEPAQMRCKDGSIKDVAINSSVLWDNGRFVHTRCFTLDVTARSRIDEAQALLAAVVESSYDAIVTKTLEGIVTSWNAGAERLFGYSAQEAIGRSITMIIPPDRLDEEFDMLARLRRGERIEPFETIRVTKSGRLVYILLRISPVRDRYGRIIGASKVAHDITASKQAERALRESDERFRQLTANAPAAIFIKDLEGRYTMANPLAREALGRSDDVVGLLDHDLLPEDVAAALRRVDQAVIASGHAIECEEVVRRPGYERYFLSVKFPLFDASGKPAALCGVAFDITDRYRVAEALKEADRRKDVFLATLAHELRNPLAPLRNSLEILKRVGENRDLLEQSHATMNRQMAHLERLVDDLLDIARISRDHIELRREVVELASIVYQALEICRPLAESGGIELVVSLPPEPIYLRADAVRLAQVFSNLLNNASKYTDRGGRVSLTAHCEGAEAVIAVRDTGRGISAELLPQIFEMFTRVDHAEGSGLGIGLTLVRRLVELHGGRVEGFSEGIGRGSEFIVRLPLLAQLGAERAAAAPAAANASTPKPLPAEASGRLRVLIVDDNVDAADSMATLLQMSNYETNVAYDGETAVQAAESFRPHVVLLDIGLPKLSGHDVARCIRAEPWGRGMVLIALTGWAQDEDLRKSRNVGFDHHMVKPVDIAALMELLANSAQRDAHSIEGRTAARP